MTHDFDAIVVGSGAGGGTVAFSLAKAGKKVLLVERGASAINNKAGQDEQYMQTEMAAFDDRTIQVNGRNARLFIGGILGGGTSLYGGVLIRPSRDDFHPGKYYSQWLPRHLWDWPITYDDLADYFTRAELLFRVAGDRPDKMLNVETPRNYPASVPSLEPINERLKKGIETAGFTPFHLPFGIDYNHCLRCPTCSGYYCPNEARASVVQRAINSAIEKFSLIVKTLTEAERLIIDGKGKVNGIRIRCRNSGKIQEYRAKVYVVAAGAVGSPVILLKSGVTDCSGQIGRNYMYHCGALAAGIFAEPTGGAKISIKQLGFTDLYFGGEKFPHKLGFAQTVPIPGYLTLQKNFPVPISPYLAKFFLQRMLAMTGIVEDLPLPENRVDLDQTGKIRLFHKFHFYDVYRSRYYLRQLKKVFRQAGAKLVFGGIGDKDDLRTSHQVGTTRMGDDPKTAVLNPDCRLYGYDNVFVVDGGFMPTSLGVSPALTIVANALRVSEAIADAI